MTQEYKELLLKDLCGRFAYNTIYADIWYEDGIVLDKSCINIHVLSDLKYGKIKSIKPYLRTMSSMTAVEVGEYISLKEDIIGSDDITYFFETYESIDWLNKKMFDYRGLIERGLALEAPEGMYN